MVGIRNTDDMHAGEGMGESVEVKTRGCASGRSQFGQMGFSLNAFEPFFPNFVQIDRGDDVAQAILGDIAVAAFGQQ